MMDAAHKLTDKRLSVIERRIKKIFAKSATEMKEKSSKFFSAFAAEDARRAAMVEAGTLTKKDYEYWRRGKLLEGGRFAALQTSFNEQMYYATETAMAYVNGQLPSIYAINYNAVEKSIESKIRGISWNLVDADTIKKLATETTSLLPYKKVDRKVLVRWSTQKTRAAITQGILQGESIPKIAERLIKTAKMHESTAITNARTMVTGAENAGRIDSMKRAEEKGVILGKEWIATNDNRTRDWHRDLNGVTVPLDEPFVNEYGRISFPGDPQADPANVYNCRCTIAERVYGFDRMR